MRGWFITCAVLANALASGVLLLAPTKMDLTKRDMTVVYRGRTFALRAYRDGVGPAGPGWCPVIIENRTPLRHEQGPSRSPAGCFAEAVRFLTALVEAETAPPSARA